METAGQALVKGSLKQDRPQVLICLQLSSWSSEEARTYTHVHPHTDGSPAYINLSNGDTNMGTGEPS